MPVGLPLPFLIGGVEIQERRPKYWNEPRRKRLSFVNSRKNHRERKEDWALVPRNRPQANQYQPRSEQDRWDLRQFEARQRFAQLDNHDRMLQLQFEQQRRQLQAPMPPQWAHQHGQGYPFGQRQQQIHPQHHQQHDQHRDHHQDARPHRRENPHDIVAIEDGSDLSSFSDDDDGGSSSSSSNDDHHHHRSRRSPSPCIITRKPKSIKQKEQLRIKPAKRHSSRRRSSSSDSDSDDNASVLRAVNHALKHRRGRSRSKSRPRSRVRPTKIIYEDDDRYCSSDDSFDSYRSRPGRFKLKK
ncbi:MAG: hypothetical protein OHK93_001513 [Ramalina farinacea]|uniref:Uncharacterized protein n=1 Tax=Ramalina farinacea TaxID=258253 RepID=A0AA43QT14_9LECA|nr:hypothetical protein [Ramalina farinacea]